MGLVLLRYRRTAPNNGSALSWFDPTPVRMAPIRIWKLFADSEESREIIVLNASGTRWFACAYIQLSSHKNKFVLVIQMTGIRKVSSPVEIFRIDIYKRNRKHQHLQV